MKFRGRKGFKRLVYFFVMLSNENVEYDKNLRPRSPVKEAVKVGLGCGLIALLNSCSFDDSASSSVSQAVIFGGIGGVANYYWTKGMNKLFVREYEVYSRSRD